MLRMWFAGMSQTDIATKLGTTIATVNRVCNSVEGNELLSDMHSQTLDTILDIQTQAQIVAPAIFEEKLRLALTSDDDRVRTTNCTDILNMAGHTPIKRVEMTDNRNSRDEDYAGLTADELRQKLIDSMKKPELPASTNPVDNTVH